MTTMFSAYTADVSVSVIVINRHRISLIEQSQIRKTKDNDGHDKAGVEF